MACGGGDRTATSSSARVGYEVTRPRATTGCTANDDFEAQ